MTHPTSDPSPPGETSVSATELRAIARNLGPVDRALVEAAADQLGEIADLRLQKAGLEALLVDAQEEIADLTALVEQGSKLHVAMASRVRDLEAGLRPFAEAKRRIEANNPPGWKPQSARVDWADLVRAAELTPEQNT